MKTREQNRNNKRTKIERFDWFIEGMQTRVAFGWLSERSYRVKKLHALELSRNQSILRFDVILQHDWPIEQCLLHIRVFFGGKTKSPCFDLFIHWLIKQITNTYRNHFSRSYENRSNSPNLAHQHWEGKKTAKRRNNFDWDCRNFFWLIFACLFVFYVFLELKEAKSQGYCYAKVVAWCLNQYIK